MNRTQCSRRLHLLELRINVATCKSRAIVWLNATECVCVVCVCIYIANRTVFVIELEKTCLD